MSPRRLSDQQILLILLAILLVNILFLRAAERLRAWLRERVPEEIQTAWAGILVAVMGLAFFHEQRWWVWTAWIAGLGALGWWLAHRVMGSVQSRIAERQAMFRRGIPPSSTEGPYAGWKDHGRIYDRANDPVFQVFLRRIASMTDDEWRSVLRGSKGMARFRRAGLLRAVERMDRDIKPAATTAILEALARGRPQGAAQIHVLDARIEAARPAGEALLARHRIGNEDFHTLYQLFEPTLPASRLLSPAAPRPD